MGLRIKRAPVEKFRDVLHRIDSVCFPCDYKADYDRGQWWLVWDGPTPVAFAGAYIHAPDKYCYLYRVGVLSTHRGHGLQRRLIRVREQWGREQGDIKGFYTYTTSDNLASANNLIRSGYRLFIPSRRWGGKRALYWAKKL